jgi:hypothetical protein
VEETGDRVVDVLDAFLTWCREHRSAITTERYTKFFQDFVSSPVRWTVVGDATGEQTVGEARHRLAEPARKLGADDETQRHHGLTARPQLGREELQPSPNPLRGMDKPEARTRTGLVTPEEFEQLLAAIPDQRFSDLLIVSYDLGGRPF